MTVAKDAFTYYAVSFDPSDTFNHTPVGTPRGVIVQVIQGNNNVGTITVTYGGVALTEVASSPIANSPENAAVYTFFLGSSIPTGTQTVSVSRSGGSGNLRASVYTLTAAADTEVVDDASATGSGADPQVALALASRDCFCSIVFRSGNLSAFSARTGWTADAEAFNFYGWYSYDTIDNADINAGFDSTSDQYALIGIAVAEVAASAVLGLLTETNSLFALGKSKQKTVGLLSETDLPQQFTSAKDRGIGLASETDTGQPFGKSKAGSLNLVSETDVGQAFGKSKAKSVGLISETNQVFALTVSGAITVSLGIITESDSPLAFAATKQRAISLLSETDIAQAFGVGVGVALGLVTETDSLFTVGSAKAKAIGLVTESSAPLSMTAERSYELGLVTEADIAFIASVAKAADLGILSESDTVFGISAPAVPQAQAVRIVVEARNRRIVVEKRDRLILVQPRNRRINVKKLN